MDYMEIELSQGRVAKVDAEDYGWLSEWKWYYNGGYARRQIGKAGNRRLILMHRAILEYHGIDLNGVLADHANLDKLDNQKYNLRKATPSQSNWNQAKHASNTSGYMGVWWSKYREKWRVDLWANGRRMYTSRFDNLLEAARAYDQAALKYHGEFATLNFPKE